MLTYMSLDGDVYNLADLDEDQRQFYEQRVAAYRAGEDWAAFARAVEGPMNPLLRATGGRVTRAVWDHPLYRVVRDMADRLGIAQGKIGAAPTDDVAADPFADEWIPVREAASEKGVTVPGLHGAIQRGQVIARPAKSGSSWLVVSRNSLVRWSPEPARQAAGRKGRLPAPEADESRVSRT